MGKEVRCVVRVNGTAATVKAHLDSAELRLSGTPHLTVPLSQMTEVMVEGDELHLTSRHGPIELQLGEGTARKWAQAITHPKSRLEKLEIMPGSRVCIRNVPDDGFLRELSAAGALAPSTVLRGTFDVVIVGLAKPADLSLVVPARNHLTSGGALWLIHPKGKASPVNERAVREAVVAGGLYESKVVAFSSTHTATKAAIPLKNRTAREGRPHG